MKNKEFDKSLLLLFSVILITIITTISLYLNVRVDKATEIIKENGLLKILITVSDEKNRPVFTEVFLFNTETNKGALIDIPGNTGSIIETLRRIDRVDVLYTEQGVEPYKDKIEKILDLEIPFYLEMTKENFGILVDLVEGVDLFISKSIDSHSEELLLPSGSVVLDGDKVNQYLELDLEGEFAAEKVSRKQKTLQSFLDKIGNLGERIAAEEVFSYFEKNVKTNIEAKGLQSLLLKLRDLEVDILGFQSILGDERTVGDETLIFPYFNEKLIKDVVKKFITALNDPAGSRNEQQNFYVEIQNGTTVNGLAARTGRLFSSFGYSIAGVKNAGENSYENTVILDRKGNPDGAKKLANIIQCTRIHTKIENNLDDTIDFTIILGKDFDGRNVRKN